MLESCATPLPSPDDPSTLKGAAPSSHIPCMPCTCRVYAVYAMYPHIPCNCHRRLGCHLLARALSCDPPLEPPKRLPSSGLRAEPCPQPLAKRPAVQAAHAPATARMAAHARPLCQRSGRRPRPSRARRQPTRAVGHLRTQEQGPVRLATVRKPSRVWRACTLFDVGAALRFGSLHAGTPRRSRRRRSGHATLASRRVSSR